MVVCDNDAIVKTFRITGLDGVFTIVPTLDEALNGDAVGAGRLALGSRVSTGFPSPGRAARLQPRPPGAAAGRHRPPAAARAGRRRADPALRGGRRGARAHRPARPRPAGRAARRDRRHRRPRASTSTAASARPRSGCARAGSGSPPPSAAARRCRRSRSSRSATSTSCATATTACRWPSRSGRDDIDAYVTEVTTRLKLGDDLRVSDLPLKDHERLFRERVPLTAEQRQRDLALGPVGLRRGWPRWSRPGASG